MTCQPLAGHGRETSHKPQARTRPPAPDVLASCWMHLPPSQHPDREEEEGAVDVCRPACLRRSFLPLTPIHHPPLPSPTARQVGLARYGSTQATKHASFGVRSAHPQKRVHTWRASRKLSSHPRQLAVPSFAPPLLTFAA